MYLMLSNISTHLYSWKVEKRWVLNFSCVCLFIEGCQVLRAAEGAPHVNDTCYIVNFVFTPWSNKLKKDYNRTTVSKKTSVMKILFSNEDYYQLETKVTIKPTEDRLGLWRLNYSTSSPSFTSLTYSNVRSSIAEQNAEAALILQMYMYEKCDIEVESSPPWPNSCYLLAQFRLNCYSIIIRYYSVRTQFWGHIFQNMLYASFEIDILLWWRKF